MGTANGELIVEGRAPAQREHGIACTPLGHRQEETGSREGESRESGERRRARGTDQRTEAMIRLMTEREGSIMMTVQNMMTAANELNMKVIAYDEALVKDFNQLISNVMMYQEKMIDSLANLVEKQMAPVNALAAAPEGS